MPDLIIYGASDDLVEVRGVFEAEFTVYKPWRGRVMAPDGQYLFVTAEWCGPFRRDGWSLGINADGGAYPHWPNRFDLRASFDKRCPEDDADQPALVIDVPEGTVVEEVSNA